MKYCSKCGNQLLDEAVICPQCGCCSDKKPNQNFKNRNSEIKTVIKIFLIIACVISGLAIIPLAWCIPMTISYHNKINSNEDVSIAFKVCTLLFVSTVAGILMLCDNND